MRFESKLSTDLPEKKNPALRGLLWCLRRVRDSNPRTR